MEEEKIPKRLPILQTIRRSPFAGLQLHFQYVSAGINAWEKAIIYYLKEDFKNFNKYSKKVDKYEHQADHIKGNIRNHLPNFVFLPVAKADFLMLLKENDAILDSAEDVAVLMEMRRTKIPKDMKDDLQEMLKSSIRTVETLEKVMELLKIILETSFGGKPRKEIKDLIHKIHKLERESDLIEKKVSRKLFNYQKLDPISIMHLLKIVDRFGFVADHVENAGDRIRAMLAK